MKVKVKLLGSLASAAGTRKVEMELADHITLEGLIERLVGMVNKTLKEQIVDPRTGNLWPPPPRITINGELVSKPYGQVEVFDGDEVTLIPPVAGG